jgi:hypothetical protein
VAQPMLHSSSRSEAGPVPVRRTNSMQRGLQGAADADDDGQPGEGEHSRGIAVQLAQLHVRHKASDPGCSVQHVHYAWISLGKKHGNAVEGQRSCMHKVWERAPLCLTCLIVYCCP